MTGPATVRRRVEVTGRVHGVFFRESCRREAARHGIAGWVLNRADGAVEAVFEGEPVAVEAMVAWARRGPVHAQVAGVVVHDEAVEGLTGFSVS